MHAARRPRSWGNLSPLLGLVAFAGLGLAAPQAASAQSTPVNATGYNRDVIGTYSGNAQAFDTPDYAFLYQNSMPAGGAFTSHTGSGVQYQLQSYDANNVLELGTSVGTTAGTLTFTAPATYSTLDILAADAYGGGSGSGTVNYLDGTTAVFTYSSPDWYQPNDGLRPANWALNYSAGTSSGSVGDGSRYLFETQINVDPTKSISGLTFNAVPSTDDRTTTGIFAISGTAGPAAVPEPSSVAAFGFTFLGAAGLMFKARRRKGLTAA